MNKKTKHVIALSFWSIATLTFVYIIARNFLHDGTVEGGHIFILCMCLYYVLTLSTWGVRDSAQVEDELVTHIKRRSSRASYIILIFSAVIIYNFFSDKDNYPLIALIAVLLIAKPLCELVYSRQFR